MPRRFYVAWAFAVAVVVILPIAIPYAIWPAYDVVEERFQLPADEWTETTRT